MRTSITYNEKMKGLFFCGMMVFMNPYISNSQNMVINPSFEEIWNCPYSLNQLSLTKSWMGLGTADPSPDFFHACSENPYLSTPSNSLGKQKARTGNAYIGIIAYLTTQSGQGWQVPANHREFIFTQLTKPLEANKKYYAEFYVSLADHCEYAIDKIGVSFVKNYPKVDWRNLASQDKAQISSETNSVLSDEKGWDKISGSFTAKGGEKWLTIGTFASDSNITKQKTGRRFPVDKNDRMDKRFTPMMAYYYIDDVKVIPLDSSESIYKPTDFESHSIQYFGTPKMGRRFTLQNIYFQFNEATVMRGSFIEMNRLVQYLKLNPTIKVKIEGHTDNLGSRDHNLKLSKQRAKNVVEYLKFKGINPHRLESVGYGSTRPILPNNTPGNRSLNRRIEFQIIEM